MTHQDSINSTSNVGKGMSFKQREVLLKECKKRNRFSKLPVPPLAPPPDADTEMEEPEGSVQHHKDMVCQVGADSVHQASIPAMEKICSLAEPAPQVGPAPTVETAEAAI